MKYQLKMEMRKISIGEKVYDEATVIDSFMRAVVQAELALVNFLLSLQYIIEGYSKKEIDEYDHECNKMHEFQTYMTVQYLVKYQQLWIQKQQRLKHIFTQEYEGKYTAVSDHKEGIKTIINEIFHLINRKDFINELYKEEIQIKLQVLQDGLIQIEKVENNVENSNHQNQDNQIRVSVINRQKRKTRPWLAEGIARGKKGSSDY